MYVLTIKESNSIIQITSSVELRKVYNGEYIQATKSDYEYLYDVDGRCYYPKDMINEIQVEVIPEDVIIGKYCYTKEDGFYENLNYKEPMSLEEIVEQQQEQINNLKETVEALLLKMQ